MEYWFKLRGKQIGIIIKDAVENPAAIPNAATAATSAPVASVMDIPGFKPSQTGTPSTKPAASISIAAPSAHAPGMPTPHPQPPPSHPSHPSHPMTGAPAISLPNLTPPHDTGTPSTLSFELPTDGLGIQVPAGDAPQAADPASASEPASPVALTPPEAPPASPISQEKTLSSLSNVKRPTIVAARPRGARSSISTSETSPGLQASPQQNIPPPPPMPEISAAPFAPPPTAPVSASAQVMPPHAGPAHAAPSIRFNVPTSSASLSPPAFSSVQPPTPPVFAGMQPPAPPSPPAFTTTQPPAPPAFTTAQPPAPPSFTEAPVPPPFHAVPTPPAFNIPPRSGEETPPFTATPSPATDNGFTPPPSFPEPSSQDVKSAIEAEVAAIFSEAPENPSPVQAAAVVNETDPSTVIMPATALGEAGPSTDDDISEEHLPVEPEESNADLDEVRRTLAAELSSTIASAPAAILDEPTPDYARPAQVMATPPADEEETTIVPIVPPPFPSAETEERARAAQAPADSTAMLPAQADPQPEIPPVAASARLSSPVPPPFPGPGGDATAIALPQTNASLLAAVSEALVEEVMPVQPKAETAQTAASPAPASAIVAGIEEEEDEPVRDEDLLPPEEQYDVVSLQEVPTPPSLQTSEAAQTPVVAQTPVTAQTDDDDLQPGFDCVITTGKKAA